MRFLPRYGKVLSGARYLRDDDGIWTGKRQFRFLLNEDPDGFNGLVHPPAYIAIEPDRGYLFYSRQPLLPTGAGSFATWRGAVAREYAGTVVSGGTWLRLARSQESATAVGRRATNTVTARGREAAGPMQTQKLAMRAHGGRGHQRRGHRTCVSWRTCCRRCA